MARLGAHLVDVSAFILPGLIIVAASMLVLGTTGAVEEAVVLTVCGLNAAVVFGIDIYLLNRYGQSIGKRWFGIMIISRNGSKVPVGVIVGLRNLGPMFLSQIPLFGPVFALVDLLFILREDRRCIHDHMAGTQVVRAPPGFEWRAAKKS